MRPFNFLPLAACAAIMTLSSAIPAKAAPAIDLGSAVNFAALANTTVTSSGTTTITGAVGVSPGTSITGTYTTPSVYKGGSVAAQAQADLETAFAQGQGLKGAVPLSTLGSGQTLTPGVYSFSSSAELDGVLNLNDMGDPNAEFVFQVDTSLTTGTAATVSLSPGENGSNVFWIVGSSATLGTGTSFEGNILAYTSITLGTDAAIDSGSALSETAAVNFAGGNAILIPFDAEVPELCPSALSAPLAMFAFLGLLLADRRRKPAAG